MSTSKYFAQSGILCNVFRYVLNWNPGFFYSRKDTVLARKQQGFPFFIESDLYREVGMPFYYICIKLRYSLYNKTLYTRLTNRF